MLVCVLASEIRFGIGHVSCLRVLVESISHAGMQTSEGRQKGCKESWKESEKVVKGVYMRREKCTEVVGSDV